jgi:hypothetical protein
MNYKLIAVGAASFAVGVLSTTTVVSVLGVRMYRDITRSIDSGPRPHYRYTTSKRLRSVSDDQK